MGGHEEIMLCIINRNPHTTPSLNLLCHFILTMLILCTFALSRGNLIITGSGTGEGVKLL